MKVLILAGGIGSRLSEETDLRPKPMVEVGGRPILWHIMKIYSSWGYNDFIILCGYKGYMIKEYFAHYYLHYADVTFDLSENSMEIHNNSPEPWKITLIDTGMNTMTGGRVLRAREYIGDDKTFMLTYGDGLGDINIPGLLDFHNSHGGAMTMTASLPEGRFGALDVVDGNRVSRFIEKPGGDGGWINAGFFVCNSEVFDYFTDGDNTILERSPLEKMAGEGKLFAYKHQGFWRPMDTLRDKRALEDLWESGNAKWKIW